MPDVTVLKPVTDYIGLLVYQIAFGAIIFVYGLHKQWWVMGSQHKELQQTCSRFAELAEVNGKVADTGLEIAKR